MPRSKSRRSRYTPPPPKKAPPSPLWWASLMFSFMLAGVAVIISNYLDLLPGEFENRYLFLGLGLITVGFIMTTRYR